METQRQLFYPLSKFHEGSSQRFIESNYRWSVFNLVNRDFYQKREREKESRSMLHYIYIFLLEMLYTVKR